MSIPKDKVQIYAPSGPTPGLHTATSETMLLKLGGSKKRRSDTGGESESKAPRFSLPNSITSPSGRARRRSSVLSEVGTMVAPLEPPEVLDAAAQENESRAESLGRRVKAWVMRPRDIFSLKLFRRGKSAISQVYRRGHLPQDAAWFILDPKSSALKRWDIFVMLLLLYTAVVTPYEVAFVEPELDFWFFLNRFIDLSFFTDLIVNFVTARFNDEEAKWIYKFGDIAPIYLKSWFTIDFVSILPFDVVSLAMDNAAVASLRPLRMIRLLRLLKLARILRASRIFRRWENSISLSYSFMSLIKFMVGVSTVAHWMACSWRIIIDIEAANENWMEGYVYGTAQTLTDNHPLQQYIAALYWSVMTITTIGYGDLIPQSHGERILATMCMLLGASIYAYVVGAVCGIVSGLDEATSKFHQTMDQLNLYMAEYHIPKPLQYSLREYFRHCRTLSRERYYHDLLVQMSPSLRGQVAVFCHSAWILKVPFFNSPTVSDEEREQFIIEIATSIEPESYPPNEAVFRVNKPANEMYIVQKGVVAKQGQILRGGAFFGEDMILKSYKRPYSVRTLTYVDCFKLTKAKLSAIIEHDEFPATRIAIRRATIALAFRVKFVTLATALGAFATAEELPRRRSRVVPMPVRIPPPAVTPVMIPPGQMPEPDPVSEEGERSGSASVTGATPMSKSSSADAGAGDAKPVSRRAAFGSDAVSAGKVAELLTSDEDEDGAAAPPVVASKDLVSPHTLGAGGAAYKQIRSSTPTQAAQLHEIIRAVERRHRETMETMMLEFNKVAKRMDDMAERMDQIQGVAASRRCC